MVLAVVFIAGCSSDQTNPTNSSQTNLPLSMQLIPADAVIESATINLYVKQAPGYEVNVHRVTSEWMETEVTWGNFGGSFDPTVVNSFTPAEGWIAVDIMSLFNAWMDGTYENFGILLDQVEMQWPRTIYYSKDAPGSHPYFEVCYTVGDETMCEQFMVMADTYIYENFPDRNFGTDSLLNTGWRWSGDLEKQTLIYFELPDMEEELAAIGDYVWEDLNMDGIQDEGEPGVEGVVVHLLDCEGTILAETMTDANGFYMFGDLMPGDYNIHFVLPDGYVFTMMDAGMDDALDSDADMNGYTVCTNLEAGEYDPTWDAGIYMPPMEGCSHTIGYWKTHAGFGPQDDVVTPLLPIWLGNDDGDKSLAVTDAFTAVQVLNMNAYGHPSNGITKLYAQLLGTKLSIADGADASAVADFITTADNFLAMYDWTDWGDLSGEDQMMVNGWAETFDDYNNGIIGPGHCDDFEDDYDDDEDDDDDEDEEEEDDEEEDD